MCTDDNYRGIVLTSSIGKVFDILLLNRNKDKMTTSDLQFAFKKKLGTTMCTLSVKEVVGHYLRGGAKVASCFLDASKAFDRVRFDRLFQLLIGRGLNALDLRALMDLYTRQQVRASWNGHVSYEFSSTNGIRQGSITSPLLYCIYMDALLEKLQLEGTGCWIGAHFVGSICYADDLTLLCPTIRGLQKMVKSCEEFAKDYGLQFNAKKSVCIMFCKNNKHKPEVNIRLADSHLEWVSTVKHLGNYLNSNLSETKEIQMKKGDLIGRVNVINTNLCDAPDEVLLPIFASQCHLYGCQAWRFADHAVNDYHTTWNRCVRRLLKVPPQTHRRFLPHLLGAPQSNVQVYKMFLGLVKSMLCSENKIVSYIGKMGVNSADTIIGSNLCEMNRVTSCDNVLYEKFQMLSIYKCTDEDHAVIQAVKELRLHDVHVFTDDDRVSFMHYLCTN